MYFDENGDAVGLLLVILTQTNDQQEETRMLRYGKYHPNYKRLYPGLEIRTEILSVLKKSDRKMQYMEVELKRETFKQNQEKQLASFSPSREDSFDRLTEEQGEFPSDELSVEETAIHTDELERLRQTLEQLEPQERALIEALFFQGVSIRSYAKEQSLAPMTIQNRKNRILAKMKKLMESKKYSGTSPFPSG